ncbi:hypothetical protein BDQ17DRAFT_1324255 [Cyathus striatus]|nr:hypothetical protein BDQ17DRAFT_1324255 [Cyathus striatus]
MSLTDIHPRLPPELLHLIVDNLHQHIPSLKACSLASRVFLTPTRSHLFHEINLEQDGLPKAFSEVLSTSPEIGSCVRILRIIDQGKDRGTTGMLLKEAQPLAHVLSKTTRIIEFMLMAVTEWSIIPDALRISLCNTFRQPTLKSAGLYALLHVPFSLFRWFTNLKDLRLTIHSNVDAEDRSDEINGNAPAISTKLDTLVIFDPAPEPVINFLLRPETTLDFSCLRKFTVTCTKNSTPTLTSILSTCSSTLQCLELINSHELPCGLDLSDFSSLTEVFFSAFVDYEPQSQNELFSSLVDLPSCIEVIRMRLTIIDFDRLRQLNFSYIDDCLSSEDVPCVRQVKFHVTFFNSAIPISDDDVKRYFEDVLATLSKKGILTIVPEHRMR